MQIMYITLISYVEVPVVAYISSSVFTFFKRFDVWVFIIFWGFLKINSGVFLHNRVATLNIRTRQ